MHLSFSLERKIGKRTSKIANQIDYILSRGLGGSRGNTWAVSKKQISPPEELKDGWLYKANIILARTKKSSNQDLIERQSNNIMKSIRDACNNAKFAGCPFEIKNFQGKGKVNDKIDIKEEEIKDDAIEFHEAKSLNDVEIPDVLINGTDEEIENFPAFQGIYGRASHIRIIASSMKSFKDSNGHRRSHIALYGLPACAKSKIISGFKTILGGPSSGTFLSINSDSTTKAGIETMFLERMTETGVPPYVFVEEMEKTLEAVLTIWLGMLDERAEIRKINARKQKIVTTKILCIATINDKNLFDKLMGGTPKKPGALSSRFPTSLYVPRPDKNVMRKILLRDIELYGGKPEWVEPCIELSEKVSTNDPRMILSFLHGQDRLITGEYQKDILKIFELEQQERKEHLGEFVSD